MQTDKLNLSYDNDENKEFITSLGKEFFSIESGETHSNWDKVESFNSNNSPFMLLGLTQTGKSTLINYLLGEKFEFVEVEGNACMALTIKKDDPNSNNDNKKLPIIGNGRTSCTYIPEMFSIPEEISTKRHALVDTAGFQDTSYNKAKVAAVEIFREEGIKRIKSIRNVIVLLTANQLMGIGSELLELSKLLGETFKKGEYRPCHFTFIVNKVSAFGQDYNNNYNKFRKNKISYEEFIEKLKRIIIEKLESLYDSRVSGILEGNLSAEQKEMCQKELEFINLISSNKNNIFIFDDIEERNFEKRIISHLDKISAQQDFIIKNPKSEQETKEIVNKIQKLSSKVFQEKLYLENMQVLVTNLDTDNTVHDTFNQDCNAITIKYDQEKKGIDSFILHKKDGGKIVRLDIFENHKSFNDKVKHELDEIISKYNKKELKNNIYISIRSNPLFKFILEFREKNILIIRQEEIEEYIKEINSLYLELNPFLSTDSINFTNEKEETSKFREAAGYISQKFQNAVKGINYNIDNVNNAKKRIKDSKDKFIEKNKEIEEIKNKINANHKVTKDEYITTLMMNMTNAENNIEVYKEELKGIKKKLNDAQEELGKLNSDDALTNDPIREQNIIVKEAKGTFALDDKYSIKFEGNFDKVVIEFSNKDLVNFDEKKDITGQEAFNFKVIKDEIGTNNTREYHAEILPGYIPKTAAALAAIPYLSQDK